MRNELSTVIKKAVTKLGEGLIEEALSREGAKGCGAILCTAPVNLEPPYEPFDANAILGRHEREWSEPPSGDVPWGTYKIFAAPEDILSLPWMETLFRAWSPFPGPFTFELIGSHGSVGVCFAIPGEQAASALAVMSGLFPALRVQEIRRPFQARTPSLPLAVEEIVPVPPYHRTLSLIGKEGASPLGIAYQAISALGDGELGVYQVLFKPAAPENEWHFNIQCLVEAERRAAELHYLGGLSPEFSYDTDLPSRLDPSAREKISKDCAIYAAICRYAVWAPPARAEGFFEVMRGAAGVLRFGNHGWRRVSNETFQRCLGGTDTLRMVVRRRAHRGGLPLTSEELASFVHLPNAWALEMFTCVERREGHEWRGEDKETVPSGDVQLGVNLYAGRRVPVVVPAGVRMRHGHVVGMTGYGKSYLLLNMILSDAVSGQGVCLIDPHGDLSMAVLSRLPEDRLNDLVYLSFTETDLVPRWNLFRVNASPGKFADDFTRALIGSGDFLGAQMGHVIRNGAYTVHVLRGCLSDFVAMLQGTEEGKALIRRAIEVVENPDVRRFWTHEFPKYKGKQLESTLNKPSRLTTSDELGATFRERENDYDPREWMDKGKVVVVNLASGVLGLDYARFLGGLLCSVIHRSALSRADVDEAKRRPFHLYLDEVQDLQSGALAEMLSEARKYGLGVVLAHQSMGQLEDSLADAVGNCSTEVVFHPVEGDGPRVRRELQGRVSEKELSGLKPRQAFATVGNRVVSLTTVECEWPVLRDGRALAREIAEKTYIRVARGTEPRPAAVVRRRERVYDSLRAKEDTP
ncbi:MAG: type IV secretion system DNA-binding domain-containing protein [Actinomycetota bacterium]|nr:type IV secretion system DNA-binding domain-containing protein [Actinomycetota bacterium]